MPQEHLTNLEQETPPPRINMSDTLILPPSHGSKLASREIDSTPGNNVEAPHGGTPGAGSTPKHEQAAPANGNATDAKMEDIQGPRGWSAAATQVLDGRIPITTTFTATPEIPGYDVESELGRGGMGVVYRARHKQMNRPVAIKMVLAGGATDPRDVQRFLFEGEVLGRIQHAQVVDIYEVNMYQGPSGVSVPFLAMELLEGGTLSRWAEGKPQPPREAAALVEGLARAVHAAHQQGVVHRDIKPANVLRSESGIFKVSDFGLAKFTNGNGADLTGTGTVVGTPQYMAPEQAIGSKQIGPAADVYSLGAVLYELLGGCPPFVGSEPMSVLLRVINESPPEIRTLREDVPRDLSAVVMKCLAKEPGQRYASAEALADDLQRYLEGRPTVARPLRRRDRAWRWMQRNPVVSSLTASLCAVILLGLVAVSVLWMRAESTAAAERAAKEDSRHAHQEAREEFEEAERQRRAAESQKQQAEKQKLIAMSQKKLADVRGAYLAFEQAVVWCEQGRLDQGLRGFVHALELAEQTDARELQRVIRINIRNWTNVVFPAGRQFQTGADGDGRAMTFTADGSRLAVVGRDGLASLYDPNTSRRTDTYRPARASGIDALDSFANACRGLMNGTTVEQRLEEVASASLDLYDLVVPPNYSSVAVSADLFAAGDALGRIWCWDRKQPGQLRYWWNKNASWFRPLKIATMQFGPDGDLWTAGADGAVYRWNSVSRGLKREFRHGPRVQDANGNVIQNSSIQALLITRDGSACIAGDRAGQVSEWNTESGELTRLWYLSGSVADLTFMPHEQAVLACGEFDSVVHLHRVGLCAATAVSLGGSQGAGVAASPSARVLVIGDKDGNVRLWDTYLNAAIGGPLRVKGSLRAVRFRPGNDQQFAVLYGKGVRIQDTGWAPAVPYPPASSFSVRSILYRYCQSNHEPHPTANVIFSVGDRIRIHAHYSGMPIEGLPPNGYAVRGETFGMTLDAAGKRLYRGTRGGWSTLHLETGKEGTFHAVPGTQVDSFTVDPNNGNLFVKHERAIEVWSADGEKRLKVLNLDHCIGRGDSLSKIRLVSGGKELACVWGQWILFIDPSTGRETQPAIETQDVITDVETSQDGRLLATGHQDNTAQVWRIATGRPLFEMPLRHERAVSAVALNEEGTVLLTGCRDGTAHSWDVATGLPIAPRKKHGAPVTALAWNMATATSTGIALGWTQDTAPVPDKLEALRARYANLDNNSLDLP